MALKNKLINHIDKIKEIVLENELLKYAVKSLQKKLEEKNHNIQQLKIDNFKSSNKSYMSKPYDNRDKKTYSNKGPYSNLQFLEKKKQKPQWLDKQNNNNLNFKKYENDNNDNLTFKKYNNNNNDNLNFKLSSQQKKIVHFNPAPPQQFQQRNIRNFLKNVQTSLESKRQPPKQSHPKIFIILKRKKFI